MSFAIAYDNVDVLLKTSILTVEKTMENLWHLTSGLFFPLMHGVQHEDLKCSKELWEKSSFNPYNVDVLLDKKTYSDLVTLLTDELDEDELTAQDCFVAWLFLQDLCTYGPVYFQKLLNNVGEPEVLEAIPLVKTKILPVYTMEVNNSTTSGNIQAIDNLLEQAGILDPDEISDDEHDVDFDVTDLSFRSMVIWEQGSIFNQFTNAGQLKTNHIIGNSMFSFVQGSFTANGLHRYASLSPYQTGCST